MFAKLQPPNFIKPVWRNRLNENELQLVSFRVILRLVSISVRWMMRGI